MSEEKERIGYIDIMKGIAIISVVVGHYLFFPFISVIIWSFHMPLFVFLNGYFYKDIGVQKRIKKSFISYIKPYIIVWFLLLLFEIVIAYLNNGNVSVEAKNRFISGFWALASNETLYKPDWVIKIGVIWFLNALFVGTILLSLILKIKNIFGQIIVVLLLLILAIIQTSKCCLPFGVNYGIAFLGWLWVGYNYTLLKKRNSRFISFIEDSRVSFLFIVVWLLIIILEFRTNNQYNICWLKLPLCGIELIGVFCGIIVIMMISRLIDKHSYFISKTFRLLGVSSLWILCVHAIDVELFSKFFYNINIKWYLIFAIRFSFDICIALFLRQLYKTIIFKVKN